jgi:hypothetical protein
MILLCDACACAFFLARFTTATRDWSGLICSAKSWCGGWKAGESLRRELLKSRLTSAPMIPPHTPQ